LLRLRLNTFFSLYLGILFDKDSRLGFLGLSFLGLIKERINIQKQKVKKKKKEKEESESKKERKKESKIAMPLDLKICKERSLEAAQSWQHRTKVSSSEKS